VFYYYFGYMGQGFKVWNLFLAIPKDHVIVATRQLHGVKERQLILLVLVNVLRRVLALCDRWLLWKWSPYEA
jgi:hypothetical protein